MMSRIAYHTLVAFVAVGAHLLGVLLPTISLGQAPSHHADGTEQVASVEALVSRILADSPTAQKAQAANWFQFALESADHDFFAVVTTPDKKVQIRGNTGVALASGLRWYLVEMCDCQFSLNADRIVLPSVPPIVEPEYRSTTPFRYRNFFNYCTFGYTMPWWDWPRWERMIDYMALHGVNMPLAITGQEAVWQTVYRELGFTDEQLDRFFVGPAHLPWGWMGNIDGLAGPLPQSWIDSHRGLQERILQRQRSLGMTPVLQAFTGHVPPSIREVYPEAKVHQTTDWAGLPGTFILDPSDPLFGEIGAAFLRTQQEYYGTDHLYDADIFNEVNPQTNDEEFIATVGESVYESMRTVDPEATWVYQGWFLHWQRDFWKEPQARALFSRIPKDRLLALDLMCESAPVWERTDGFYGNPWVWNVICNLGQKVNLSGDLSGMQANLRKALSDRRGDHLSGIGVMMEGFGYNPVVQSFVLEHVWHPESVDLKDWLRDYVRRRYGSENPRLLQGWQQMVASGPYSRNITAATPLEYTPHVASTPPKGSAFNGGYDDASFAEAVGDFLSGADELRDEPLYQFDAVNFTREYLFNVGYHLLRDCQSAANAGNAEQLRASADRLLELFDDIDRLLGTHERFLLGKWIADAKSWGTSDTEKAYLERNARTIITVWQPVDNSGLLDYASKHWNGLVKDFYKQRWESYFDARIAAMEQGEDFDRGAWSRQLRAWELAWTSQSNDFATEPAGDAVAVATELYAKYLSVYAVEPKVTRQD